MDILFKRRVKATEQMAQNCMDISQSKNQREVTADFSTSKLENGGVFCEGIQKQSVRYL